MKRFLSLTLSVFMIISAVFSVNTVAFADDKVQQCGDNIEAKYSASQNTLTLSGSGAMWDNLNFPWAGKNITDIIIKDGITHIGNSAFAGMLRLENVLIPNTVKSIGRNAFSGSILLKSVNLSASVETIGAGAFRTNGVNFKGVLLTRTIKALPM